MKAIKVAISASILSLVLCEHPVALARTSRRPVAPPPKERVAPAPTRDVRLETARKLASDGKYQEASKLLFQMSRSSTYESESAQIKYIMGLMLYEMHLYQASAFVFYDVIRQESANPNSRYLKQSLQKLSLAADQLDSDVLLKYAIKKINEEEFPAVHRDMLYYRMGELKMDDNNFAEAGRLFGRVKQSSSFFSKAKYKQGLAYAQSGDLDRALAAFEDLETLSSASGITDANRVNAVLGRARVLYQKKDFDKSIEAYREIPRDTEQWHEALFESSWAYFRAAQFRSALSNFHSLHSSFYDDYYQPESLMLRAIVYLYICRFEEVEKVLNLFEQTYKPVFRDVRNFLVNDDPGVYYREIKRVIDGFDGIRKSKSGNRGGIQIPFLVARQILHEGDIRKTLGYLERLNSEKKRLDQMPASWLVSGVGKYARKIVEKRLEATHLLLGKEVRKHLTFVRNDLRDLMEQNLLLRYEMIGGKKETIKKEIAGKGLVRTKVIEDTERDYFVQNGYDYWPFSGEYWLDEIGNYHFVGVQACDQ